MSQVKKKALCNFFVFVVLLHTGEVYAHERKSRDQHEIFMKQGINFAQQCIKEKQRSAFVL